MNYTDGGYTIITFGEKGEKLHSASCNNFLECVEAGEDLVQRGNCHSFCVLRCVYAHNTKDLRHSVSEERQKQIQEEYALDEKLRRAGL